MQFGQLHRIEKSGGVKQRGAWGRGSEVLIKICILSNIKSKCWNLWNSRSGAKTRISSVGSSKKSERVLGCDNLLLASVSTLVEGQPQLCLLASHTFQVKVVGARVEC